MTLGSAEIHFCILPHAWGRIEEIGESFLSWLWKHSEYVMLIGPVPGYNRLALRAAIACGFTEAWVERDKLRKNGKAYDVITTSISRPAVDKLPLSKRT
jgi:RimJ/RimL family protein N-acetyltransferase